MLFGCAATAPNLSLRDNSPFISQQQASERSRVISDVDYQLTFFLSEQSEFKAKSVVNFNYQGKSKNLSLDLNQANIQSMLINGKRIYPNYNGSYIIINPSLLNSGQNSIEVEFTRQHSTNGEGLHRFVDPVDGKVYLYSHFEPAAAQQMFAVFDQPDLKATFQLTVNAPKDWQVISAMRETSVTDQGETNLWQFPASPKLSPYNFSMHAGPYHVWQDNSTTYPMRLFARQSVIEQVTAEDWFTYTKQGLRFFNDYFGIPYPFKKYDQILVPDFLYGAMENAAAITFSEDRFLFNAKMNASQKERLAGVIMHEMAHQWFGNLVTMKWWNGLWLNESFAAFMGTLATSEATEFSHAWRTFYASGKQRAFQLDSLVTTHPIEVPVATTQNAFDNIDAITYQKGASALKQLRHLLGAETFRQGVSQYLKDFSYQNAELDDFIESLAKASNRDLSQWTQQWLYQAGVNRIKANYICENDTISEFTLEQTAVNDEFPTLRQQKVQIGLFYKYRSELSKHRKVAVTYQGKLTDVKQLVGEQCPDLVYPNLDDWGFVKVDLDERSLKTAKQSLSLVHDPLLRSMLWQSLWDSVIDGQAPLNDFINVVLINAPNEHDYTILGQVIDNLYRAQKMLDLMAPMHQDYATKVTRAISQMSLRMVMEHHQNSDFQRRWFAAYIHFSTQADSLSHIQQLLLGKSHIRGLTLDQDLRWALLKQLNRFDYGNAYQLLMAEKAKDSSDSGQKAAIAAQVIRPQAVLKRQWLHDIEHNHSMPFSKKRVAMFNLYPAEQKLLSAATAEERLTDLIELDKQGPVFMRSYTQALIPQACSQDNIELLDNVLNSQTGLSKLTRRALLETRQYEQRCVNIKFKITH
ncbi:aminopeptidase N [Shewanella aestuarii]|uniref:Aminopeptidase N n=1 Tax=Shewanella aestuarii TaxID=1028752 RepID=A0A6G9QQB8_9GAMM|nr:aminopeptidase N [Shewanella aestuarii]QIR16247.1 aminopeptidase N [Shewanella aestuarii]